MKHTNEMKINGEMAIRSLSDKAAAFYSNTDPLTVYEYDTDEGKRFDVAGVIKREGLTFGELDELFSSYYEEMSLKDFFKAAIVREFAELLCLHDDQAAERMKKGNGFDFLNALISIMKDGGALLSDDDLWEAASAFLTGVVKNIEEAAKE